MSDKALSLSTENGNELIHDNYFFKRNKYDKNVSQEIVTSVNNLEW